MRIIFFLMFTLCCNVVFSQNYLNPTSKWHVLRGDIFDGWTRSIYYIDGDSTINGNVYHKLIQDYDYFDFFLGGMIPDTLQYIEGLSELHLIREDSSKFYRHINNNDWLIIDFDLELGDTVGTHFDNEIVVEIDTVEILGLTRRVFTTNHSGKIYEGIGTNRGGILEGLHWQGDEGSGSLICYSSDSELYEFEDAWMHPDITMDCAELIIPMNDCPEGDILLTSQQDINDFVTQYPNCTEIVGNVQIGSSAVNDLSPLTQFTSIGTLRIEDSHLTDLTGLNNLTSLGSLLVGDNDSLMNLVGLENIDTLDYLNIASYSATGFFFENNSLSSMAGLDNLTSVGHMAIGPSPALTDLTNLSNLTYASYIEIYNIPATSLNGLNNLTSVEDILSIGGCTNLTDLTALNNLTSVGSLLLGGNTALTDLTGLGNITSIEDDLYIGDNDNLNNIIALENIISIEGDLNIYNNKSLNDLTGLDNVTSVGGRLDVYSNDNLVSLSGLDNLASTGDDLWITDNVNLSSLTALENLTSVGGDLQIAGNDKLYKLKGLENLTSIENLLSVSHNANLRNLIGLDNVNSIGDGLWIVNNADLSSLTGLENIDYNTITDLNIYNNPVLSICNLPNICDYLENGGTSNISNNASNCNTQTEIDDACNGLLQCPTPSFLGAVYFASQQDIDDFVAQYPNCTELPHVLIRVVNDLSPLTQITSIHGLWIEGTHLTDLTRLDNLTSLQSLIITENDSLVSLEGLENITTLDYLNIGAYSSNLPVHNEALTSLKGLDNLTSVREMIIEGSPLTDLTGLDNLTSAEKIAIIFTSIVNLNGLENLTSLNSLWLWANPNLMSLEGLQNVDYNTITNLAIESNPLLSVCNLSNICDYLENGGASSISNNISGCNSANEVEITCTGSFPCPNNILLTSQQDINDFVTQYPDCTEPLGLYIHSAAVNDLSSLTQITSVNSLRIEDTHLADLTGLNNLNSVGSFRISSNDSLINLIGLESLNTANSLSIGYVSSLGDVFENTALMSLTGLDNLMSVGGLLIAGNPVLTDLISLSTLDSIRYLRIYDNSSLANLNGLENLTSVESIAAIANESLTDLTALNNLTSVNTIRISYNASLTDLTALSNLAFANAITISHNDSISDLNGLQNIDYNTISTLYINNNPMLSVCGFPNICNYLENGGASYISINAPNCNTKAEVLEACDALPIEALDKLQVYLKNKTAILTWRTATETNNAGFEMQKSKDGITWEKIGWQEGQGNTLTPYAYTYRDENPFFGTSYYRFKQVDFNGDFRYSNVVSLQYIRSGITVFPNPNTGIFEVQSTARGTYQILNTSGQIIQEGELKNDILLDISDVAQGVYFISVTIDSEIFVQRMVKM